MDDDVPLSHHVKLKEKVTTKGPVVEVDSDSDPDDNIPLSKLNEEVPTNEPMLDVSILL